MKNHTSKQVNTLATIVLSIIAFFTPLIVSPLTTEYFDTPKFIFLLIATSLLLILTALTWIFEGKVLITRTPLDGPMLIFLLIAILSSIFSSVHSIAFIGALPRIHGSATTWINYILLYFLATSTLRSLTQVKYLFYALISSTAIVCFVSLLSYFGAFLPFAMAQAVNFDLTGSSFSSTALAVLLLPAIFVSLLSPHKFLSTPFALIIGIILSADIALTGSLATIIASLVVIGLILFTERQELKKALYHSNSLVNVTLAGIIILIGVLLFGLSQITLPGRTNFLRDKALAFSKNQEIQLPFATSWKVSAATFTDNPVLGTGPSTYLFDFGAYKPLEYNNTKYWAASFDSAYNEFLQVFATLGGFGLLALLLICIVIITFGWTGLRQSRENPLTLTLSVSALALVVLLALHVSTLPEVVIAVLILAMLMSIHKSTTGRVEELTIGIKASRANDSQLIVGDVLPIILLSVIVILLFIVFFNPFGLNAIRLISADYHHRLALNQAPSNGLATYQELVKAEQLNPYADSYRIDLSITNFNLANAIASKAQTKAGSSSATLSDQDKQDIQQLLSQSINEGKAATTLNPLSSRNWQVLGSVYRQISGVAQNALSFSLDAFGHAIERDPLNPGLRLSVGGIYYSVKNYDLAVRFFTDAVNLKPDYANAYYNLSIALRDKGDLTDAETTAEQLMKLIDPKSPDYQVAANYLADLKTRIANAQKGQPPANSSQASVIPPAAQETGPLQQKQLPKVLNLPSPSSIATPSAIKK